SRVVGQCGRYSIAEFLRSLSVGREYFAFSALQYSLVSSTLPTAAYLWRDIILAAAPPGQDVRLSLAAPRIEVQSSAASSFLIQRPKASTCGRSRRPLARTEGKGSARGHRSGDWARDRRGGGR